MRKVLDCAVLLPPGQGSGLLDWLRQDASASRRYRIHVVELDDGRLASRAATRCEPLALPQATDPRLVRPGFLRVATRGTPDLGQHTAQSLRANAPHENDLDEHVMPIGSMGPLARALTPWPPAASSRPVLELAQDTMLATYRAGLAPSRQPSSCVGARAQPLSADTRCAGAIAEKSLYLRRFDLCLLPVSAPALGWTRLALLNARDRLYTPVLGVLDDMKAPAIQDLLDLGLRDFVHWPICAEELAVRMQASVARNRPTRSAARPSGGPVSQAEPVVEHDEAAFRDAKAHVVRQFEHQYLTRAMACHGGNVSQAARASGKHRRAFWALLRKHRIDAAPFREGRDGLPGWRACSEPDEED